MARAELWEPKACIEADFRRALLEIAKQIVMRIGQTDDPRLIRITLDHLSRSPEFVRFSQAAALKMVTGLFADQGRTWREAARHNMKGRMIYEALRNELRGAQGRRLRQLVETVSYRIVTLPQDVGQDVAEYVARESLKGRRASDIAEEIRELFPARTRARAALIARTQTSMTTTDLTRARCEKLGLDWYVWRPVGGASGDGRTRNSHRHMAGVLVNWNDPPAPEDLFPIHRKDGKPYRNTLGHYHAGQCPNCRCYPEPIIDLSQISWPARVYHNGSISRMSKRTFERMAMPVESILRG